MTDVIYRIIPDRSGFKVEVNRPGQVIETAAGFTSEADAQTWITEDKRIADIDNRQEPIQPPHLRKI